MHARLPEVIGAIYDCVADEGLWPETLARIGAEVDGFLTTLAVFETSTRAAQLAMVACEDDDAIAVLQQHAGDFPFYHLLDRLDIDQPGPMQTIFSLYGADGAEVWRDAGIFQHFHRPFGVRESINMAVLKRPNRVGTFNISVRHAEVSREHYDFIAFLGPHIRRALSVHDMVGVLQAEQRMLREIIDRLEHGVVVVTETMEILFANAAAERFLRQETLLHSAGRRIAARFAPAQAALSHAVALSRADEVLLGPAGIDVPLGMTARPAVAHVLPLSRRQAGAAALAENRAAAAIFIAAAGVVVQTAIEAIAALFGLTSAERRVAHYVADGMTRQEIAQAQGVTEGTVKSQLAAIFDKTGTGDQRSLQVLMKELTPPVRRN